MRLMRAVAMHTQQIGLVAVPLSGASPVHAGAPVAELFTMTLTAEHVRLVEGHLLAARQMQHIAVIRVVAIEAPPMLLVVFQLDLCRRGRVTRSQGLITSIMLTGSR